MPPDAKTLPFPGLPALASPRAPTRSRRDAQPLLAVERRATEPMVPLSGVPLSGDLISLNEEHTAPPVKEELVAEAHGVLGRISALRRRQPKAPTVEALEALDLSHHLALAQEAPSGANLRGLASALGRARRVMQRSRGPGSSARQAQRMRVRARVSLRSPTNLLEGRMEDLSVGGLFLATAHPLPVGAEVELALTLLGEGELLLNARVAWVRDAQPTHAEPAGIGLTFEALDSESRAAVERFIERRAPLRSAGWFAAS